MHITVKKFPELTVEELYEILRLRSEVFVVEQDSVYQDLDDKDQKATHFFVKDEEEVVAVLRVLEKGEYFSDAVTIGRVVVKEVFRKEGLAGRLLKEAISFVWEELRETDIKIAAQSRLIPFYKKYGFTPVSEEYILDTILHTDMILQKEK